MPTISHNKLWQYLSETYRLSPLKRLKTPDQAIEYINERGLIFFWPVRGIQLPSLWAATAGDRPVADEHDDPGHVTWGWKDSLLGKRHCYYAKILKRRGTFLSNSLLPNFYALSENYGSPEEDYLIQYQEGRLTQEARRIYEVLLDHGPLDTITLRKTSHLSSPDNESPFNKALDQLMADFKVLPIGTTDAGGWHYSYLYDTVSRYYPRLAEQARSIDQKDARIEILKCYIRSVGAATIHEIQRLFQWKYDYSSPALASLTESGLIFEDAEIEGQKGSYFIFHQLS
jgi:hypothetical protein